MGIFGSVMQQFGGTMGHQVEAQVAGMIATKLGIDPAMAQSAITALTAAHTAPTDTVQTAATQTGMSTDLLSQIVHQLGGEGALGSLAGHIGGQAAAGAAAAPAAAEGGITGTLTGMLDRDGDGNPMNDVSGMLGGLMGGKNS